MHGSLLCYDGVMNAKQKCIFCNAELNDSTKPEHILLSALRGRKKTRDAICSDCNNLFGGEIDNAFASQVEVLRNLLQLESGTGKPPPAIRNVQAGTEKLNFRQDGKPELVAPPFTVTTRADGEEEVQVIARSEEHLKEILPHLAGRLGISEPELIEMLKNGQGAYVEKRPERTHFRISLGGEDSLRSMAKSCLVLLSIIVGNDAVRAAPFDAAREFVVKGGVAFAKNRACIDCRELPGADVLEKRFGPFFNLIYIKSDAAGRVIGHFTLYNTMAWQLVLAEAGGPANATVALASNPLAPASWTDNAADIPDIPFTWLDAAQRDFRPEGARERLNRMLAHHRDAGLESEVGRIAKDVFERHGVTEGKVVTDEASKRAIINELAARMAAYGVGLPRERPFSPSDLDRLVEKKEPESPAKSCFICRLVKFFR